MSTWPVFSDSYSGYHVEAGSHPQVTVQYCMMDTGLYRIHLHNFMDQILGGKYHSLWVTIQDSLLIPWCVLSDYFTVN